MNKYTPQEDRFLIENHLTIPMKRISKMMGRNESSARQRLVRLGYTVPQEIAHKFKQESCFKKGSVPANKGKAMPEEIKEKVKATWFVKGSKPHNIKSDGAISMRKDKTGKVYKYIRTQKAKWELYHRYLWQNHHGHVPEDMIVSFKDGNSLNCDINNLELISREENMKRNSVQNLPEEIKNTIRTIAVLNRKINSYVKNN
jgi:hypothetical protein